MDSLGDHSSFASVYVVCLGLTPTLALRVHPKLREHLISTMGLGVGT